MLYKYNRPIHSVISFFCRARGYGSGIGEGGGPPGGGPGPGGGPAGRGDDPTGGQLGAGGRGAPPAGEGSPGGPAGDGGVGGWFGGKEGAAAEAMGLPPASESGLPDQRGTTLGFNTDAFTAAFTITTALTGNLAMGVVAGTIAGVGAGSDFGGASPGDSGISADTGGPAAGDEDEPRVGTIVGGHPKPDPVIPMDELQLEFEDWQEQLLSESTILTGQRGVPGSPPVRRRSIVGI